MSRPAGNLQTLETKAQKAENNVDAATTQNRALEAAIEAAEHYMSALRLAGTPKERQRLDAKCKELLTRAEDIKKSTTWSPRPKNGGLVGTGLVSKEPVSTRTLSKREQIILLEDSKLNGAVFPPWKTEPDPTEFELPQDGNLFTDSSELHLSSLQQETFDGWKRPSELLASGGSHDEQGNLFPTVETSGYIDLVQDVTTDCSVVASLCAAISQVERGYSKSTSLKFYPSEGETSSPKYSASGKYIFRMHFNGCYRKVVIDDRLPSSNSDRSIHVIDRNNPSLLWPALIEKAYLKVRGGYDFPGSNSGTDLWILTGWIPEQIFLHHEDVASNQLWQRLLNAFSYGDVLVTIGTGQLTEREEKELGLIGIHDYAVLDVKQSDESRQLLVKNPWAAGVAWKGAEQPEISIPMEEEGSPESKLSHRPPLSPGTFWIDFDKALQNFENLYLNWNPQLFAYRQDIHFSWDLAAFASSPGCFAENPQFAVSSDSGGTVWLLLSRHFKSDIYTKPRNEPLGESSHHDGNGFISIYLFKKDGQRVYLSDGAWRRGPYVDSPNTLMRFEMPPNTTYTVVASEQSLARVSHNFSLSAFSTNPASLAPATEKYATGKRYHSAWTRSTAGGNADSERYPSNPQFSIEVLEPCDIAVLLEPENTELATNVKIVWSNGSRVSTVRSRDIITDSGAYRRGCALAEGDNMVKGVYTIVCSTFAPDQLARFSLSINATKPCITKPLPAEGAGRLSIRSGLGTFPPGTDRIIAFLTTPRLANIKLIGRLKGSRIGNRTVGPSPILVTLELGQGPYKEVLAASNEGDFSDSVAGVRIESFDLQPELQQRGGVWVIVERVASPGGQVEDTVEVEVLSEERVTIGPWRISES